MYVYVNTKTEELAALDSEPAPLGVLPRPIRGLRRWSLGAWTQSDSSLSGVECLGPQGIPRMLERERERYSWSVDSQYVDWP